MLNAQALSSDTRYLAKLKGFRLTELGAEKDAFPDKKTAIAAVRKFKRQLQDAAMVTGIGTQPLTPDQSRAARAFLKVSQRDAALGAGISEMTLRLFELRKNINVGHDILLKLKQYFERHGITFKETAFHWSIEIKKCPRQRP